MGKSKANEGRTEAISVYLESSPVDFPFTLTPITALREVVALCDSIATGHPPSQSQDRKSLRNDVQLALHAIGPKLRQSLQPALRQFRDSELAKLPDLLGESPGSKRLGTTASGVIALLRRPMSLRLAWKDVVEGYDEGLEIDKVRQRAVILRELDESLGHEWIWRKGMYRKLLSPDSDPGDLQLIEAPPTASSAEVAWFVFADADLPEDALRVGQIQFF